MQFSNLADGECFFFVIYHSLRNIPKFNTFPRSFFSFSSSFSFFLSPFSFLFPFTSLPRSYLLFFVPSFLVLLSILLSSRVSSFYLSSFFTFSSMSSPQVLFNSSLVSFLLFLVLSFSLLLLSSFSLLSSPFILLSLFSSHLLPTASMSKNASDAFSIFLSLF